jgi:diguanylate cyclase (GGDEF)-like protein
VTEHAAPADLAELLATTTTAIGHGADLDATVQQLLAGAATLAGADVAAFFAREPDGGALHLAAAVGLSPEARAAFEAEVVGDEHHPIAVAAREGRPTVGRSGVRPDGAPMTSVDLPVEVSRDGIRAGLGVVSFGWPGEQAIDDHARAVLEATAGLLALVVDRARLVLLAGERGEWLGRIAGLDPLTGLANRRTLDRVLELEIARAARQGSDVSIAVFDVDSFRALNQDAGGATGDEILRVVASVLAEQVRLVDTVARIGGDEFVVVAPGSGGVTVADRVLRAIDGLEPVGGIRVSVSAGVARFPTDGTAGEELLDAALAALEGAKAVGRGSIAEVRAG